MQPPPQHVAPLGPAQIMQASKIKLILLCHSSAVEESSQDENVELRDREVYHDEYGKCSTFSKVSISVNDRVITLKKLIETKFGIACTDQILVYKDKILKNDLKPLSSYKLRQFSRVHIFDERDLKENSNNESDEDTDPAHTSQLPANANQHNGDMFGVYQQGNFLQPNDSSTDLASVDCDLQSRPEPGVKNLRRNLPANVNDVSSSSLDSQNDRLEEMYKHESSNRQMINRKNSMKIHSTGEPYRNNRPPLTGKESKRTYGSTPMNGTDFHANYPNAYKSHLISTGNASNLTRNLNYDSNVNNRLSYYTMSSSRYRKLDELFDQQINIQNPNLRYEY